MMLQMKFDNDRPAGRRDIQVWTDGRRLESHPISSPRAFGSGKLKNNVTIFLRDRINEKKKSANPISGKKFILAYSKITCKISVGA